jgi:hypothetical protein
MVYLDLQDLITVSANASIVHFVVGIVCVSTAFIFNKGESGSYS